MSRNFNRHSNNDVLDAEHINELQEALEQDDIRIDGKADADHNHDDIYAKIVDLGELAAKDEVSVTDIAATGTPNASTYLSGDGSWKVIESGGGGGAVDSVNGQTGVVELTASDVGAASDDHQHEGTTPNSTALGQGATVGFSATALGHNASAGGSYSAALGYGASTSGTYATALGSDASASGSATSLGYNASAGSSATALGYNADASSSSATALGNGASAGASATAVGRNASATGSSSTSLGHNTSAGPSATAVGSNAVASGNFSTALGYYASAGTAATAVGRNASAGTSSAALGRNASAAEYAIAVGQYAIADDPNTATITAHTLTLEPRSEDTSGTPTQAPGAIQMYNEANELRSIGINADDQITVDGNPVGGGGGSGTFITGSGNALNVDAGSLSDEVTFIFSSDPRVDFDKQYAHIVGIMPSGSNSLVPLIAVGVKRFASATIKARFFNPSEEDFTGGVTIEVIVSPM